MLMKPMQRITRYPLLFKRLLPNLVPDSQEHRDLVYFLKALEQLLGTVNNLVRKKEAAYRIKMVDEGMDFGTVAEVIQINFRSLKYL
jgi:RhoGEF domain